MILYPYGNKNPHYLSNDLMVTIFQQFLLEVRFSSYNVFSREDKDCLYLFWTNIHREGDIMYYTLDRDQVRKCENLDVLISLIDKITRTNIKNLFILCSHLHVMILIDGKENAIKIGGESMLKDICEQYMFSRTARIQKLPRLDSPYLKCQIITEDTQMVVEFSTTLDIPVDEIAYNLHYGDIDILSIRLYPLYDVNRN